MKSVIHSLSETAPSWLVISAICLITIFIVVAVSLLVWVYRNEKKHGDRYDSPPDDSKKTNSEDDDK